MSTKSRFPTYLILVILSILLLSLVYFLQKPATPVTISYYHWKNSYRELTALQTSHPAQHLYLKFLDLGYHHQLTINPTRFIDPPPTTPITIPVVYLDNRALANTSTETIFELILKYIPARQYQNLQIDCDWSGRTREKYFDLLERLKTHYSTLSATLRLHQVKFAQKTGVPPVSYTVLMYYNMSEIRDINARNYVLDHAVGKQYLQNFQQYPLRMELALPLYQQIRVIRQHRLALLLPHAELAMDKLQQHGAPGEGKFTVTRPHYWQGEYLYAGDQLIVDQVSIGQLQEVSHDLARHLKPQDIIFYSYQDAERYAHEALQQISVPFQ